MSSKLRTDAQPVDAADTTKKKTIKTNHLRHSWLSDPITHNWFFIKAVSVLTSVRVTGACSPPARKPTRRVRSGNPPRQLRVVEM